MSSPKANRDLAPDALDLNNLVESELLSLVSQRYMNRMIYTFVGPTIVIAMNPFRDFGEKYFKQLYSQENMARFQPGSLPLNEPHIYSIGANALRQMSAHKKSQAILITGESGAGKTESTKILLRYFADMTGALSGIGYDMPVSNTLESRLTDLNLILESFGNACTSRNHNSSRFGKWIELVYDRQRNLKHAQLRSYVLETARVLTHNASERNYHVFYRLFQSSSRDQCSILSSTMNEFESFCKANKIDPMKTKFVGATKVDHGKSKVKVELVPWEQDKHKSISVQKDDQEDGPGMITAFDNYGLGDFKQQIYHMVLGIILIGCLQFETSSDGSSGQVTKATEPFVAQIARYIGFSTHDLMNYLTMTRLRDANYPANVAKCHAAQTSLAKTLYDRLFTWLVRVINKSLAVNAQEDPTDNFIGLLDIAGFESFDLNGLDQLLINFNNENLQRIFNVEFIAREIEVYEMEGISNVGADVKKVFEEKDNLVVIKAIEGLKSQQIGTMKNNRGIFDVLVQTMKAPGKVEEKDLKFVSALYNEAHLCKKYDEKNSKAKVRKARFGAESFVVEHYASDVLYNVGDGWIEKITLAITPLFDVAVSNSDSSVLTEMFEGVPRDNKNVNLIDTYLEDIHRLLDAVDTCDRQYIRTIKPNMPMSYANGVDESIVKPQLSCSGVMEAVKIRQGGHGFRETYRNLVISFSEILTDENARVKKGKLTYGQEMKKKYKEDLDAVPMEVFKELMAKAIPIANKETEDVLKRDPKYFKSRDETPWSVALSKDSVAWGKTMLFCKNDPRDAFNVVLNKNLKARFEREVFGRRLASAWLWYKTKEERLAKERSCRIFEDCLKWKQASDKAQKRVPDLPGGLFLYPKSIIGGVKTGEQLIKSAAMLNTLVKALVKLDQPDHVTHTRAFQTVAHRMVTEGNCIVRAENLLKEKREANTYTVAQYKHIYDLIGEAKRSSIYNPIFDDLNKLATEVKYILKDDPKMATLRGK